MITYEPPEQQEVNVGDRVVGIGVVMDPDDFVVPGPVSCWCGDPATVQVHEEPPVPTHVRENYPEVACNSECSPDSVINDIWRFLRV